MSPPLIVVPGADPAGLPVVTGCPVPAAAWGDSPGLAAIRQKDGSRIPAQVVPISSPTPGGVRWVEVSFKATATGPAELLLPSAPPPAAPRGGSDGATLDNGRIRIRLSTRPDDPPIRVETGDGALLGTLAPVVELAKGALHRDAPAASRTVRVLRDGPLRQQAEVSGALAPAAGPPSFNYRLTVELWDGLPAVRVDWMLAHQAPGKASITVHRATLEGDWEVGPRPRRRFVQTSYGPHYVSREVSNPAPVGLIADFTSGVVHVSEPAMLLDDQSYPRYLAPPTVQAQPWLALEGAGLAVFATLRDFCESRPNRLQSDGSRLAYDFIPPGHVTDWPQGRRREQTLLLAFGKEGDPAAPAVAAMTRLLREGRALPEPGWLSNLGCFEMDKVLRPQPGRNIRLSRFLRKLCALDTPGDKFNLGDTPETGYTRSYAGTPNCLLFKPGAPPMAPQFAAHGGIYPDSFAQFLEPVWTNNEYDVVHGIAQQVLRTGDTGSMTMLRWTARHQVEVDFVSFNDDPWHHRASPFHSHFHNTKGAISSHFFTQGLVQYYLLTGDRDALEVVEALGDKIVEIDHHAQARTWKFDREIGWGLLALVCLVEAGLDRFRPECDTIARFLMEFDRAAFTGAVKLSRGKAGRSLERQMVDNGMGYTPLVEAMDRYQRVTGRADAAAWLETLLRQIHAEMWNAIEEGEIPSLHDMNTHMLAIGYERTGDPAFIRTGLVLLDAFLDSLSTEGGAADFWGGVKPHGKLFRALTRYLGHADRLGMLGRYEYPSLAEVRALRERPAGG